MNFSIHQAIVTAGDITEIYTLHEIIRQLLWAEGPDYVRLLSPICYGLGGKLASFALVPHGFVAGSPQSELADSILDNAAQRIGEAGLRFVKIAFGRTDTPPVILNYS
jgi:hypothetical protein